MLIKEVNQNILSIWDEFAGTGLTKYVPMLYSELKPVDLLFVGLNPSFTQKAFKSFLKGKDLYKEVREKPEEFYTFRSGTETVIANYTAIEEEAIKHYNYFNKFKEIAQDNNCTWTHIDLLFIRNTSQQEIQNLIKTHKKFVLKQLNLSLELLKIMKPRVIVVANALASKLLLCTSGNSIGEVFQKELPFRGNSTDHNIEWSSELGTYLLDGKTPLFVSGMLSGQLALDNGSFDRLKWHIKLVLEKLSNQ